jgi:bifunctional non-homologous end joining protein LigD
MSTPVRLRLERDGDRVRLITWGRYDWTKRYPWIVVGAAVKNRHRQFVIDGEANPWRDSVADFNALQIVRVLLVVLAQ